MNKKMIKGAALTGLGVALLLGGGGTLAVWNDSDRAEAGKIVSGDLQLKAQPGTWTSELTGKTVDVASYKVVPGDRLTYRQVLDVTLVGDELRAALTVTGAGVSSGFQPGNVDITGPTLTDAQDDKVLPDTVLTQDTDGTIIAETTFDFVATTSGRDGVNAGYDFSGVGYRLEQIAPGDN